MVGAAEARVVTAERKVTELEEQLIAEHGKLAELERHLEEEKARVSAATGREHALLREMEEDRQRLRSAIERTGSVENELFTRNEEIARERSSREAAEQRLKAAEEAIATNAERMTALDKSVIDAEQRCSVQEHKNVELMREVDEARQQMNAGLEREKEVKRELDEEQQKLRTAAERITAVEAEMSTLASEFAHEKMSRANLEREVASRDTELSAERDRAVQSAERIKVLEQASQAASADAKELRRQVHRLEEELRGEKTAHEKKKQAYTDVHGALATLVRADEELAHVRRQAREALQRYGSIPANPLPGSLGSSHKPFGSMPSGAVVSTASASSSPAVAVQRKPPPLPHGGARLSEPATVVDESQVEIVEADEAPKTPSKRANDGDHI